MANAPNDVQLFEVNLISDQVSMLLRRRAFQQLSGIATVLMIIIGTTLALLMAMHMGTALHIRSGTESRMKDFENLQKLCADLDSQRAHATLRANALAPLLPIARQRVVWAPKLAAVAAVLPPGTGVVTLQASQRDVFIPHASTSGKVVPFQIVPQDESGMPQMAISILCLPSTGGDQNLGVFAERLKKNPAFMNKFDFVHLVAMEQDSWQAVPVEILHIRAVGTPR